MTSSIGKPRKRLPNNSSGFTLIELILVTLILAVLVGVSAPLFRRSYRALAHETCADNLVQLMDYARQRAVMERLKYRIRFDTEEGAYWLLVQDPESFPERFVRLEETWGRRQGLPEGTRLKMDLPAVTFYPDGTATEAVLELVNDSQETVLIRVDPVLGKAQVVDHAPQ